MITLYIVFGSSGEYSGRMTWMVEAFTDEEKALHRVIQATDKIAELVQKYDGKEHGIPNGANEFDLPHEEWKEQIGHDLDMYSCGEVRYHYATVRLNTGESG